MSRKKPFFVVRNHGFFMVCFWRSWVWINDTRTGDVLIESGERVFTIWNLEIGVKL